MSWLRRTIPFILLICEMACLTPHNNPLELRKAVSNFSLSNPASNTASIMGKEQKGTAGENHVQEDHNLKKLRDHTIHPSCTECHYQIVWSKGYTLHGKIFYELKRNGSFGCVSCHDQEKFKGRLLSSSFNVIDCQCCHGAGNQHREKPVKENIRKADESNCLFCHQKLSVNDQERKNNPHDSFHHMIYREDRVRDHQLKGYIPDIRKIQSENGNKKLQMDLFVMSLCPYAIQAEEKICSVVKRYSHLIDFNLYFIANDLADKESSSTGGAQTEHDPGQDREGIQSDEACMAVDHDQEDYKQEGASDRKVRFRSLHGLKEIEEDMRQLVIKKYYPLKWIDYLEKRNLSLESDDADDWEAVAQEAGLSVDLIKEKTKEEGEELLASSIRLARERQIRASPTLYLNNVLYQNRLDQFTLDQLISLFRKSLQGTDHEGEEIREDKIQCVYDADCILPGKIGNCLNPDTSQSECRFHDVETIPVSFVYDETNSLFGISHYISYLIRSGYQVKPVYIPYNSREGVRLITRYNSKTLPLILFQPDIKDTAFFHRISASLVKAEDSYRLSEGVINSRYVLPFDFQPHRLEVFLDTDNFDEWSRIIPFLREIENKKQVTITYSFYSSVYYQQREKDPQAAASIGESKADPYPSDGTYSMESISITHDKKIENQGYSLTPGNVSLVTEGDGQDREKGSEAVIQTCILRHFPSVYLDYLDYLDHLGLRSGVPKEDQDMWSSFFNKEAEEVLEKCVWERETRQEMEKDLEIIKTLGIVRFPSFLVNNKILITGYPDQVKDLVFDLLE